MIALFTCCFAVDVYDVWWMLEWWDTYSGPVYRYSQLCNIRDLYSAAMDDFTIIHSLGPGSAMGKSKKRIETAGKGGVKFVILID